MRKLIIIINVLIVLGVGFWIVSENPALIVRKSVDRSVAETIIDHRLPELHLSYRHDGKPELVVTKEWTDELSNTFSKVYWCKVIDKTHESKKPFWIKFADRILAMLRFMAFDERGAFILTENEYVEGNEVLPGEYIYIGMLRVTIHLEGYGTGVWEFPGYVDYSMPFEKLNALLKLSEGDFIEKVRQMMYSTTTPEQSYQVHQVERGATRRETWQPWINLSCDVTVEYMGDGINAKYPVEKGAR